MQPARKTNIPTTDKAQPGSGDAQTPLPTATRLSETEIEAASHHPFAESPNTNLQDNVHRRTVVVHQDANQPIRDTIRRLYCQLDQELKRLIAENKICLVKPIPSQGRIQSKQQLLWVCINLGRAELELVEDTQLESRRLFFECLQQRIFNRVGFLLGEAGLIGTRAGSIIKEEASCFVKAAKFIIVWRNIFEGYRVAFQIGNRARVSQEIKDVLKRDFQSLENVGFLEEAEQLRALSDHLEERTEERRPRPTDLTPVGMTTTKRRGHHQDDEDSEWWNW